MLDTLRTKWKEFSDDLYFVTTAVPMSPSTALKAPPAKPPWWMNMERKDIDQTLDNVMRSDMVAWYLPTEGKGIELTPEWERHLGHIGDLAEQTNAQYDLTALKPSYIHVPWSRRFADWLARKQ